MKNLISNILVTIFFLLISFSVKSQSNYLYKKVSVDFKNIPLEEALDNIAQKGGFTFAYNSRHFDEDELVSLQVDNKTISRTLNQLFDNNVKYKVVGSHVILSIKDKSKLKLNKKISDYKISGYIIDSKSGRKIQQATIYEVNGKVASLSNPEGFYSLTVPAERNFHTLSYSKHGYLDTVIIVEPLQDSSFNIYLNPVDLPISKLESKRVKLENFHTRPMVKLIVPEESKAISDNLVVHDPKLFQVSFVPYIGTNRKLSGSVDNNISLNILAGYSGGVNGFELGGVANIVRRDVNGSQLAGVANIVGGDTKYFQMAGVINLNSGSVTGTQIGGFSNVVLDTLNGVQIAGFNNTLHGYMNGVQLSGFNNVTTQNADGIQLTGFVNVALGDVKLGQISGFANYGSNIDGMQLSGFANIAKGDVNWGQFSGFANYGNNVEGGQVSGFANVAQGDVNWGQISGFANYGHSVKGVQLAGFGNLSQGEVSGGQIAGGMNIGESSRKFQISGYGNIAREEMEGFQLAGYFNYAKKVNGYQLAIFNISDTIESGMPIGLFSFVKTGLHRIELSSNEVFYTNLSYKMGLEKLYNAIRLGYDYEQNIAIGYGVGTKMNLSKKFNFNVELTSDLIIEKNSISIDVDTDLDFSNSSYNTIGVLNRLNFNFDYKFSDHFSLFAGPSINASVMTMDYSESKYYDVSPYNIIKEDFSKNQLKIWVGGNIGLAFTL